MGRNTQKNLRHLSQRQQKTTKVKARFTEKIIHTFSNYVLSEEEKQALSYSLDKHIPVKLNKNNSRVFIAILCNTQDTWDKMNKIS